MELLLDILAVLSIATVMATARITRPLRDATREGTWLGDLLRCGFCQSYWWTAPIVVWRHGWHPTTALYWLVVALASGLAWYAVAYYMKRME